MSLPRLTRPQMRKILKYPRTGELKRIAEQANVSFSVVSEWFTGRNSNEAVGRLINKRVAEMLAEKAAQEARACTPERVCA